MNIYAAAIPQNSPKNYLECKKIHNDITKTLQLTLCLKLYESLNCLGSFSYYNPSVQNEKLLNAAQSYKLCNPRKCSLHFKRRKRRQVPLRETFLSKNSTKDYVIAVSEAVLNRTMSTTELTEEIQKREYNFFRVFFTLMQPDLLNKFLERAPSWNTNFTTLDWSFFKFHVNFLLPKRITKYEFHLMEISDFFTNLKKQNPYGDGIVEKLRPLYETVTELLCYQMARGRVMANLFNTPDLWIEPYYVKWMFWLDTWQYVQETIYGLGTQYKVDLPNWKVGVLGDFNETNWKGLDVGNTTINYEGIDPDLINRCTY